MVFFAAVDEAAPVAAFLAFAAAAVFFLAFLAAAESFFGVLGLFLVAASDFFVFATPLDFFFSPVAGFAFHLFFD